MKLLSKMLVFIVFELIESRFKSSKIKVEHNIQII